MSNSGITKYERKLMSICIMWFHVCTYLCACMCWMGIRRQELQEMIRPHDSKGSREQPLPYLIALNSKTMDREAWRAAIHGVTKSWTQLSNWTELNWSSLWEIWQVSSLLDSQPKITMLTSLFCCKEDKRCLLLLQILNFISTHSWNL